MSERWLPVVGYEGLYEVSDQGGVRSLDRVTVDSAGRSRPFPGKILAATAGYGGYPEVNLSRNNNRRLCRVHVLVLAAFAGPRPDGMLHIRHLSGDPSDSRLENLAYGTASENTLDDVRHGRHNHADKTHCKWGHEFTADNTYCSIRNSRSRRQCRQCTRDRSRRPAT